MSTISIKQQDGSYERVADTYRNGNGFTYNYPPVGEKWKVGKWIDGKPIYRRVLSFTMPPLSAGSNIRGFDDMGPFVMNDIVDISGYITYSYGSEDLSLPVVGIIHVYGDYAVHATIEYYKSDDVFNYIVMIPKENTAANYFIDRLNGAEFILCISYTRVE